MDHGSALPCAAIEGNNAMAAITYFAIKRGVIRVIRLPQIVFALLISAGRADQMAAIVVVSDDRGNEGHLSSPSKGGIAQ
jgi:hypothetical protein